jgi:transcriptional antiterminator NusG
MEETFEARPDDEQDPATEPTLEPAPDSTPDPIPEPAEETPDESADDVAIEPDTAIAETLAEPDELDETSEEQPEASEEPQASEPDPDTGILFEPGPAEPALEEAIPDQPLVEAAEPLAPIAADDTSTLAELSETEPEPQTPDDVIPSAEEVPAEEAAIRIVDEDEAVTDEGVTTGEPAPYEAPAEAPVATEVAASAGAEPAHEAAVTGVATAVAEPEEAPAPAAETTPPAAEEPSEPAPWGPFDSPGDWYVVHTYAGYENKVKANLQSRIGSMQMEDKIFDVVIPMEDVMEIKGGKKQVVQKKVFPGYLLVKMFYDNDSWYVVRNTPGVTGFVVSGTGQKPTPLSRKEVEKILTVKEEEKSKKPSFRLEFEESDVVRIISGPFADFNGTIVEINVDQSKLKVLVNIFDRETPVELGFDQVARV